jgi:hypothetical protein
MRVGLVKRAEQNWQVLPGGDRLECGAVHGGEGRHNRLVKPAELMRLLGSQLTWGTVGGPQQRLVPCRGATTEAQHVVDPQPVAAVPAPLGIKTQPHRNVSWTAPGNLEALSCRIRLCYQGSLLIVVIFLEFFRWNVTAGRVEPLAVVPGNPFHGSEGDIPDATPRAVTVDELFLVKTIHRLRSRIIIRITLAPHGADRINITQPLRVPDRGILDTPVGVKPNSV